MWKFIEKLAKIAYEHPDYEQDIILLMEKTFHNKRILTDYEKFIAKRGKLQAIKLVRDRTQASLEESKNLVCRYIESIAP